MENSYSRSLKPSPVVNSKDFYIKEKCDQALASFSMREKYMDYVN
jgi:hypothetical protein